MNQKVTAHYHLPGLFEFYEFYKVFLPIYREHRDYFYDWCDIGSIYGAPADCIWGGGRVGFGHDNAIDIARLMDEYGLSARLTFSNSLLTEAHLSDKRCNRLCEIFETSSSNANGVIVYSDLLLNYIKNNYPNLYFVSSTTKVITDFDVLVDELNRPDYQYVVPDFRLNKRLDELEKLTQNQKEKLELLCNENCAINCTERKACYENVSRLSLGEDVAEHICPNDAGSGYRFSNAMENPSFISTRDITDTYLPLGINNFKIEGRSLGSALILEFILYYMAKPKYHIHIREMMYLDNTLDLF